jgi:hypothetical protein
LALNVPVVAIATSQEIGKFLNIFAQLFGKILKLLALNVLVLAIATSREIGKFLFSSLVKY